MSVSEEEAKAKWCPQYRFSAAIGPAGDRDGTDNRPGALENNGYCLGSACMAWRNDTRLGEPGKRPGFCGLAGPSHG